MSCTTSAVTKFSVSKWTWCDMREGFTYVRTAVFVDLEQDPVNITADDFSMEILDADGNVVDTLSIGAGLEIVDTGSLNIAIDNTVTGIDGRYTGTLVWTRNDTGAVIPIMDFVFWVGSNGDGCETDKNTCKKVICGECDVQVLIPVGIQGAAGSITQDQFNAMMDFYNSTLDSYASEEDAIADGKVAGDEWLWSADTDVGIAGDKHIQRTS